MQRQLKSGCAKSKLRPSGNSASKKQTQRFEISSGTSPVLESSNDNDAPARSSVLWFPERVRRIDISEPLPGEIHSILQSSDPPAPPSTERTNSIPLVYQGIKKRLDASSKEQIMEDPLSDVFGPMAAEWLRDKFPTLR